MLKSLFYFILFYTFAFSILNFNSKPKIQMKQTFNFLLMLVMVATVLSCKKTEPAPELTPAQKIVGKYKLTAQVNIANGITRDVLANSPACSLDDISEFTTDGKFVESEGATSCVFARDTETRPYVLSTDGKTLTITYITGTGATINTIYTVVELSSSVLKLSFAFTQPDLAGGTTNVISNFTYTKI